jgi:arabinogalactan oligomer/maltooligosaccharide transport system permease protein
MNKPQTFHEKFFKKRLKGNSPFELTLIHGVLILACVITLYPALRVLTLSLRPGNRVLSTSLKIIPSDAFSSYILTGRSLKNLKSAGMPDKAVDDLADLKDQVFDSEAELLKAIGDRIGGTQLTQYKTTILANSSASFSNYISVLFEKEFLRWLWNSAIITCSTSIIGVILASTSAYAFSRWNFPGRTTGLIFLLTTQMIPAVMLLVPIYVLAAKLNLINTWVGLVVAYSVTSIPFSIWILKGYYDTIPVELEQSAMVDGTSRLGAFYRIILPLSTPALSIVFLFNFMTAWNDFVLARVMLQKEEMYTWPLGLFRMMQQYQAQWGMFAAGALMVTIPVMTLFMASSRFLVSGLTLGATKG